MFSHNGATLKLMLCSLQVLRRRPLLLARRAYTMRSRLRAASPSVRRPATAVRLHDNPTAARQRNDDVTVDVGCVAVVRAESSAGSRPPVLLVGRKPHAGGRPFERIRQPQSAVRLSQLAAACSLVLNGCGDRSVLNHRRNYNGDQGTAPNF